MTKSPSTVKEEQKQEIDAKPAVDEESKENSEYDVLVYCLSEGKED